jgi:hypothetical protein
MKQKRVSEVDLMSAKYPLSVHRRVERQWAERFKSLSGRIVVATERTLQRVFNNKGSLLPVPVRTVVSRRRIDPSQTRD